MSDCRRTDQRLAEYVDESLPPAERADVERHLDACPPCRAHASREQGARDVLRARAERLRAQPLPPGLRSRCAALATRDGAAPMGWRRFATAVVAALLVVFSGVAILSVVTERSTAVLAAQLTADHVRCFNAFAPADAPGIQALDVQTSLAARYGWDVHVPPSDSGEGLELIGGRRCLYVDGRIPHLMYRVNGQDLSLFILDGAAREQADVTAFGHRSRVWTRGDRTFVLVAPESAGALDAVARHVREEAR